MDSYLKGRQKAQLFHANIPITKDAANLALKKKELEVENIVRAEPKKEAADAPQVDMVLRNGVVRKIIIHMPDGNRLELECSYKDDEE